MKIVIKTEEHNLHLPIPNCIVLNKIIFASILDKYVSIPKDKQQGIYTAVKKLCKNHKGLTIVEVETQDKEYVKITL